MSTLHADAVTETAEPEVTTRVIVDADALCHALDDVLLCAPGQENPDLPMLDAVHLHTTEHDGQTVLVLTATDRYLLGMAHLPAEGSLPPVLLPLRHARALAALVQRRIDDEEVPHRAEAVTLDVPDPDRSRLLVGSPYATEPDRTTSSTTVLATRTSVTFPQVSALLAEPVEPVAEPVALNPQFLRPLLTIADRTPYDALSITTVGANRAVRVRIGERFHALLMPRRPGGEHPRPFAPPAMQH